MVYGGSFKGRSGPGLSGKGLSVARCKEPPFVVGGAFVVLAILVICHSLFQEDCSAISIFFPLRRAFREHCPLLDEDWTCSKDGSMSRDGRALLAIQVAAA